MTAALRIATLRDTFGLVTADSLPPRPRPVADHAAVRAKWPEPMRQAFARLKPHALHVVATEAPVAVTLFDPDGVIVRRIGGNRGCWPMRLATSGAWGDTVTTTYDKSPFVWMGTVIRVWLADRARVKALAAHVTGVLAGMAEAAQGAGEMRHGFRDVGPDVDLDLLEGEIHAAAARLFLAPSWDDDALELRVRRMAG